MESEKKKHSFFGVAFLWILFGATAGYALFFSFFLSIEHTSVNGVQKISKEGVEQLVAQELSGKRFKVWPRNNFFAVQPEQLEGMLRKEYPLIRTVSATRVFPNGLRIQIEERDKIVTWCSNETCDVLDEEGVLSESANSLSEENAPYRISISDMSGQAVFSGQKISDGNLDTFAIAIGPSLRDHLGIEASETYTTASRFADELRVKTKDGWELYLNTTIPIDASLEALELLFEKELPAEKRSELKYIDLRAENRAYYVLQNSEGTTVTGESSVDVQSKTSTTAAVKAAEKEKKKKK